MLAPIANIVGHPPCPCLTCRFGSSTSGGMGHGVTIYIVDSGIHTSHTEFVSELDGRRRATFGCPPLPLFCAAAKKEHKTILTRSLLEESLNTQLGSMPRQGSSLRTCQIEIKGSPFMGCQPHARHVKGTAHSSTRTCSCCLA